MLSQVLTLKCRSPIKAERGADSPTRTAREPAAAAESDIWSGIICLPVPWLYARETPLLSEDLFQI